MRIGIFFDYRSSKRREARACGGGVDLRLGNVWGDREPEALVWWWIGGNRCCNRLEVGLVDGRGRGRVLFHDFPTYIARAWWRWDGGRFYFVSADDRFSCALTDCASTSQPIQIFAIDGAGRSFVDVTRTRPDLIADDAAGQWEAYRHEIVSKEYRHGNRAGYEPLGLLLPWCADDHGSRSRGAAQALRRDPRPAHRRRDHSCGPSRVVLSQREHGHDRLRRRLGRRRRRRPHPCHFDQLSIVIRRLPERSADG